LRREVLVPGIAMLVIGLAMVGYTFLVPIGATGTLAMITILYVGGILTLAGIILAIIGAIKK
jgi:hypothetical protein